MIAVPASTEGAVRGAASADLTLVRQTHDSAARERLIRNFMPLVETIARRYLYSGEPYDDLVQVGSIGLIKAIDRFEPERGVDFAAFAAPTILGEIRRYLRDLSAPIRIPRRYQEIGTRIRIARRQLTARLQRSPTTSEVAAAANLSERELVEGLRAEHVRTPVSLSEAEEAVSTDEVFAASDDRLLVSNSLRSLHRRERQALRYRYFGDLSQDEIASRMGVSQTQTSRLIASGLAKLRADLEGQPRCAGPEKPLHSGHGDSRCRRGSATGGRRTQAAAANREVQRTPAPADAGRPSRGARTGL